MELNPKALRKLFKQLESQGWAIEKSNQGWKCKSPNGQKIVTVHNTVSDHRAGKNILSELRKAGFVEEKRKAS